MPPSPRRARKIKEGPGAPQSKSEHSAQIDKSESVAKSIGKLGSRSMRESAAIRRKPRSVGKRQPFDLEAGVPEMDPARSLAPTARSVRLFPTVCHPEVWKC